MKRTNIIAETAWHHEGSKEFMEKLLDSLIKTDVDYIKLHITVDLDEYMDSLHPAYDTLKNWMFSVENWKFFIQKIINGGKRPFLLLNDKAAVDLVKEFNPQIIEIHSVCLNDIHLLLKVKESLSDETQIVLGIGGSTLYEIENAISILGSDRIIMMHGFQNYPTKYEDVNFGKIRRIMKMFPEYSHGYADHCGWDEPNNIDITLMGAALGMDYIEKHVTTDYGVQRCDWNSAISIEMLETLIEKIRVLEKCEGTGKFEMNSGEKSYAISGPMKKAAKLKRRINCGDQISIDDIYFQRTCEVSGLSQLDAIELIGKVSKEDKECGLL